MLNHQTSWYLSAVLLVLNSLHGGGHSCELSVGSFAFAGCKSPIREAKVISGETRESCIFDKNIGRSFSWHCNPNGGGIIFDYYTDPDCTDLSDTGDYTFPGCNLQQITGYYIKLNGDCCTEIDDFVSAKKDDKEEEEEEEEETEEEGDDNGNSDGSANGSDGEEQSEDGRPKDPPPKPIVPLNGTLSREELRQRFETGAGLAGQLFARIRSLSKGSETVFKPMVKSDKGVNSAHVARDFLGFKPKDKSVNFNTFKMHQRSENAKKGIRSIRNSKDLYRTLAIDEN